MVRLTRRYRFCSSHRLHAPSLSEDRNREVFGKCNNPFGHGHNYVLEVTVGGELDETTGRVVDIGRLDALVRDQVLNAFDHRDLNSEVFEFQTLVPTSENLTGVICSRLQEAWPKTFTGGAAVLDHVRVFETERNIIDLELEDNT